VDWSAHSIRLAAMLAQVMHRFIDDSKTLKDEGRTYVNSNGNTMQNPLLGSVSSAASQIMSMRRTLSLHALSGVTKGEQTVRKGTNKANEKNAPENDDDLLNAPVQLRAVK